MKPDVTDLRRARLLWDYLRLGVPVAPADCLLVFGGYDLGVAGRAADLYHGGIAPLIVVSGGSRAVPDGSDFPTEADAIADVLLRRDVPKNAMALERLASNTSENFWLSAELLRDGGLDPHSFLAVTKPYGERRILATARRRWPHKQVAVTSEETGVRCVPGGRDPGERIGDSEGFDLWEPFRNRARADWPPHATGNHELQVGTTPVAAAFLAKVISNQ